MPSFRSPLPTLSCFLPSSGVEVTLHPPSFLIPFLSHFLNTVRERWLLHLPAKLPKPGLLSSPRARTRTHAHWGNSGTERSGSRAPGPWNHPTTAPPASANQMLSGSIMQITLRALASEETRPPPSSILFHPSRAELAAASLATGAPPIFPCTEAEKKNIKMVSCGHLDEERVGLARPQANSLSVASGTLPVAIWNRLEILNNLPRPYFASGKQKSSSEQTTFEYFLQASRLKASSQIR